MSLPFVSGYHYRRRMGFMDSVRAQVQENENRAVATQEMAATAVGSCPNPSKHYVTEVNKGSIRMQTWQSKLNEMFAQGYRLAHVLEQDGNTVQVFEHRHL